MKKSRIVAVSGGLIVSLAVVLFAGHERAVAAGEASAAEGVRAWRTAPVLSGTTREEMSRNYRSCLFSFLPQIGSDAAAEMVRDACREEYLHPER